MGEKAPDTKRNIMERVADYFSFFLEAIKENMWVRNEEISFREIAEKEGYIRGTLYLHGGYKLHVSEYIIIKQCGRARSRILAGVKPAPEGWPATG